ncbi:hypothetical protein MKW94_001880 [Papaver nudicaule]|uniref:Glycosyltransferase n=1 Tax=Papaver nudicaule TaxID=74823 RepID=A0AA41UZD0_PAPNU|nr:hypothetical protein [Papaver nudicaule]
MSYLPQFFAAVAKLQEPFEQVLRDMEDSCSLPICVISDFFLGFTLDICRKFNVPRVVFHGMGVLSTVITKHIVMYYNESSWNTSGIMAETKKLGNTSDKTAEIDNIGSGHIMNMGLEECIPLPGLNLPFSLSRVDIPENIVNSNFGDPDNPITRFFAELVESETNSWGVIVNSFAELENEHVGNLESFCKQEGAKAWCVGPLFLYHDMDGKDEPDEIIIKWLDEHEDGSVVYASFGTQAEVSDLQLDEVLHGLEMSSHPFIFVVRSKMWLVPDGLEGIVRGKCLVVREWVNQRRILSHKAIGGFLSHCGWNSVLEGISCKVPILAWPMMAEQPLNARIVVDGFGIGLKVPMKGTCKVRDEMVAVGRGDICTGVYELMASEKGMRARENVKSFGDAARQAVQKDGSSFKCLNEFISALTKLAKPMSL